MSLFGALDTAGSGLTSQAAWFTNISDDVANSQSTGFKRVDTSFEDFFTTSNATVNNSGAVVARPDYVNTIEGTVTQTDNTLALAIKDQGFFPVSNQTSTNSDGSPVFDPTLAYTRDGNFQMNKLGYLQNDVGQYLNAWPIVNGTVERNSLVPLQINQESSFAPVATTISTLSANLPPNSGSGTPPATVTTSVDVYDAQGAQHQLNLTFAPVTGTAGQWNLTVTDDGNAPGENGTVATIGSATITFGPNGTPEEVKDTGGATGAADTTTAGAVGNLILSTKYLAPPAGSGNTQNISLSLGTIGATDGLTQEAATQYTQNQLTQNGIPPGTYTSTSTDSSGNISINYSNGQSVPVGRVPIVTFEAPDQLQRQNGQAFSATVASGQPQPHDAGTGGAGGLATDSLEASNVDIGTEFTNLIVAQQAYTANAKVVTTANTLLQTTINMVQ